jgi:hypothetical protein
MRQIILAICVVLCSAFSHAATETLKSAAQQAAQAVELARKGDYGRLSAVQMNMILEARNRIQLLANENASIEDFDSNEQRIFDHARERINRLTRSTDKERLVCKRVMKTGTRFVESECLTVAQREARAKSARERTEQIQRPICPNALCDG